MKGKFFAATAAALALQLSAMAAENPAATPSFGIINFTTCITESKLGKQEQESFEALKKQMDTLVNDAKNQLIDISSKLRNPEFMDGISPEKEKEMRGQLAALEEEYQRYQNQYYQVLNQAQMQLVQTMKTSIDAASEKVAKAQHLSMIVNKDACFFYSPQSDITNLVIKELDKEVPAATKAAAAPAEQNAAAEKPAAQKSDKK